MNKKKIIKGFIYFMRGYDLTIHKYPNDFNLLAIIAQRAKRTNSYENINLEIGDALIGDFDNYGMTEQQYRTSKRRLIDRGYITVKATPKGTIARLVNSSIFDINPDEPTDKLTDQKRTGDEQSTTNNNDNNENNDKKTVGLDYLKNVPPKDIEELVKSTGLQEKTVLFVAAKLYEQYSSNEKSISFPAGLLKAACKRYKENNPKSSQVVEKAWYMDTQNPEYFSNEAEKKRNEDFEERLSKLSQLS